MLSVPFHAKVGFPDSSGPTGVLVRIESTMQVSLGGVHYEVVLLPHSKSPLDFKAVVLEMGNSLGLREKPLLKA